LISIAQIVDPQFMYTFDQKNRGSLVHVHVMSMKTNRPSGGFMVFEPLEY
jgi:hypothetical protein